MVATAAATAVAVRMQDSRSVSDCAEYFLLILDIPHYDLLKCQINQRHFYDIAFLELQIQTALCSVSL